MGGGIGKAEEAFEEARRRIAVAKRDGAEDLDLSLEGLKSIPKEIAGLKALKGLYFLGARISDLDPISDLTGLSRLLLENTGVIELGPIARLIGLRWLELGNTRVTDLSALSGLIELTSLDLSHTRVSDLSAISGLTKLERLDFSRTSVSDLSVLSGLAGLTKLTLSATSASDLSAISGLTELAWLSLSGKGIRDITAISGLRGLRGLDLVSTGVSDLSAITGLTRIERLDLSQTAVGMADLKKLVGIKKLVSGPGPDTNPQEFRGLRFGGCAATREDARVAEISRIEDPSERARVLFEYLETWVPPIPPELPEQTHRGLRYRVGPSGLVDYDPASSPGLATAQQRQLHAFLVEDAGQMAELFGSGHNQPFAYVSQKLGRYGAGLGAALEEISPAIVWKVGNDLRLALAADGGRRPGDMTNRPAFDVDQRAGLEGLVSTHNALVSLHPDLAALDAVAVDPAQRHVVERDRALMEAAIEAFAAQTRLILVEVVRDLRDLHDEALGETRAAIRAMRIEEASLENLIKAIVTQAIIEARGPSFVGLVAGDVRAAAVGAGVAAVGTALPPLAATYPQLVMVLQPHIAALMAAWHGKDYPVSDAVNWIMAKVRAVRK